MVLSTPENCRFFGEGLGRPGICASSDQHAEGGGSVHRPGKQVHTPGLGSAVSSSHHPRFQEVLTEDLDAH